MLGRTFLYRPSKHAWNCMLKGEEAMMYFQGFEVDDFRARLVTGGDNVPEDEI